MGWSNMKRWLVFVVACACGPWPGQGADWPTFAHDSQRSYVTDEALKPPLHLQWVYDAPAPPAAGWSLPVNGYGARKNKSNVSYDDSHPAILVGDSVYFCSSAENCVHAVAAESGEIRWTFFTDAAPRLAPTFWRGKLFFGADDGRVYCLDAEDGSVVWTHNAAPTAETMLGYGRFSSVWPIRTGVMIDEGVAYFTAGLFPSEGVYLYAVDPQDGRVLWRQGVGRLAGGGSLAPQGYMLATRDSIFVTSRVAPSRFNKRDGRFIPFATPFPNRPKAHEYRFYNGGDYAQIWDGRHIIFGRACLLSYDPDEEWTNRYRKTERGQLRFQWFNARQTVLRDGIAYFAMDDHLLAIDQDRLPAVSEAEIREFEEVYKRLRVANRLDRMAEYERIVAAHGEEHSRAKELRQGSLRYSQAAWDKWLAESPALFEKIRKQCRWMVPLDATESLILAGDVLYAGGENDVYAIDASGGKLLWQATTDSRVRSLAAANGRLTVSTVDGKVRCYAKSTSADETIHVRIAKRDPPFADGSRTKAARQLVDKLLERQQFPRGHALIVGGDGQLAYELARRTGLTIQLLVKEQHQLADLRTRLAGTGLYGHRITVRAADLTQLPFAPYLFNLAIDAKRVSGGASTTPTSELFRVTRPQGGIALIAGKKGNSSLEETLDALSESGAQVERNAGQVTVRRGELPGTQDWSHNYASPANTSCSEDQKVKGPFGILWYGEPGPRQRIDRHATGPMPLVVGGIMFTIGYDRAMAYDVYNGAKYWDRFIHGATRSNLPLATSNIVADETGLFIIVNNTECRHLDALTGETLRKFSTPSRDDESRPYWGWLAREQSLLCGSRAIPDARGVRPDKKHSDELFAVDLQSGEFQWQKRVGRVEHDGIAIGDGRLFYVDRVLSAEQREAARKTIPRDDDSVPSRKAIDRRGKPIEPDLRKLVALDSNTGKVLWELPFDASDITLDDNAILDGRSGVSCMVKDGVVVVHGTGSLGHPHRQFLAGEFARRAIYAFSSKDGGFLWGGRKGYRKRPIIAGDFIYAEPFAWHVKTGQPKTIVNPLSGEPQPLDFHRGYIGCSHLLASGAALFGNKNGIGYCNLDSTEGFSSFRGLSLACGLGATPANGVFVAPEGRSGCTCAGGGIHTSVALYPRTFARDWAGGVTGGIAAVKSLPVKHAFINLGAPGFREDEQSRLWVPYPTRNDNGFTGAWLPRYQHDASMFYYRSPDVVAVKGHELSWLLTSGYHGAKALAFRLQEKGQPEANYTITLYFAELEDVRPGQRLFDVSLQGKPVLSEFDVVAAAGDVRTSTTRVFHNIAVGELLTIALKSADDNKPPLLCAVAIEKE